MLLLKEVGLTKSAEVTFRRKPNSYQNVSLTLL